MATTKKTYTQKLEEASKNLPIVSQKLSEIEAVASLTDNETVKTFILDTRKRYEEDVMYLRNRIIYCSAKIAQEMSVEQFAKFSTGLAKLVS